MKKDFEKMERHFEKYVQQYFNKNIKPKIKEAMRKAAISRVEETNGCIFIKMKGGKDFIIESDFNDEQNKFYETYISPLESRYTISSHIEIKF